VAQLLPALAATPTEREQAFTGALALATGDDCPVACAPLEDSCPGTGVSPIAFDRAVTGTAAEAGGGGELGAATGAVGTADPVVCATAAATAFCTPCTVVSALLGDVVAPAGVVPATAPDANSSPDATNPMEISRFRLKVMLLLYRGYTPALKPAPSLILCETRTPPLPCECAQHL